MLDISNITRVYNGKLGCMCGCNGKYSTNPAYKEEVGKWRGYPVDDDECSERSVRIIAKKVLSNPNAVREGNYIFVEDRSAGYAGRIQVVYFKEGSEA